MLSAFYLTILRHILAIVFLLGGTSAFAAEIPKVTFLNDAGFSLGHSFLVLEDLSGRLTPEQALSKREKFGIAAPSELHRSYSDSVIWILLQIENRSSERVISLASGYPSLELDAFRVEGQRVFEKYDRSERRIPSLDLPLESGNTETLLLRVSSKQLLNLDFYLSTVKNLDAQENSSNMFYALIFGCFLTAFLSNFALFLVLRYRSHLYYLLFSLVNCHLAFMAISFPSSINDFWSTFGFQYAHAYSTLGAFTTFLFVRNFLQTKDQFPLLDFFMQLFMGGCLVIAGLEIYDYSPLLPEFADLYYQLGILLLIVVGVNSYRSGFSPSKYYLISLFCFLGGILIYLLLMLGYLPSNLFTVNALLVGQTAEMLLMSLALSSKLKMIERESNRSAMKTQLIKTITHDISNPLSIIKISTQYFESLGPSKSLGQIDRATRIIENLIHYVHERRVSDSVDLVKFELVSLNEVFEDVAFAYSMRAEAKNIRLNFVRSSPERFVWSQKSTLAQQILGNLISNAIKYSPNGETIDITTTVLRSKRVMIEIKDRGEGMKASEVTRLLRNLERNNSTPGTLGETGFGYGISIVKDTLKIGRGRLEIVSKHRSEDPLNCGTVARIILPSGRRRMYWAIFPIEELLELPRKFRMLNP